MSVNPKMKQLTCLLAFIFSAVKPKGGRWEKLKGRRTVGSTKNSVEKTVKGTAIAHLLEYLLSMYAQSLWVWSLVLHKEV